MQNSSTTDIEKVIEIEKIEYTLTISHKFFAHDKPVEELTVNLDSNPSNIFYHPAEAFIHKYFTMNADFEVVNRNEDCTEEDDQFKMKNLRMIQDISGRAFLVNF